MKDKLIGLHKRIVKSLELGIPILRIAEDFDVNPGSIHCFINRENLRPLIKKSKTKDKTLVTESENIVNNISGILNTEIYRLCSREMERIEHSGAWLGNGHHAAQFMQAEIMKQLEPILDIVITEMVLR